MEQNENGDVGPAMMVVVDQPLQAPPPPPPPQPQLHLQPIPLGLLPMDEAPPLHLPEAETVAEFLANPEAFRPQLAFIAEFIGEVSVQVITPLFLYFSPLNDSLSPPIS